MDIQNPVTRLSVETIELTNGITFQIVHNLPPDDGTFERLFNRWLRKTNKLNHKSLIQYVRGKKPYCICVTKDQYDEVLSKYPSPVPATKEEYDAEQSQKV